MAGKKLKILHVTPAYLPATRYGGPLYSVHGLCRALAERGHTVDVFTPDCDGRDRMAVSCGQRVARDGVGVYYFHVPACNRFLWSPSMEKMLVQNLSSYDVLHTHTVYTWPNIMAARAAEAARVPYAVSPRGMLVKHLIREKNFLVKSAWIRLFEKRSLERASAVHLTAHPEAEELSRFHFKLPRCVEIPNGIDPAKGPGGPEGLLPSVQTAVKGPPFLLYLGRVNWKKGIDHLIGAMKYVADVPLIIAGNDEEGYQARLEKMIRSSGLTERVRFIGWVDAANKTALLKSAKMFILPSRNENFGNVLLEAMQAGCPVVVSPYTGLSELIGSSGAGIVADTDPEQLGRAIQGLLKDPARLDAMRKTGPDLVERDFRWPVIAEKMERLYYDMINSYPDQGAAHSS